MNSFVILTDILVMIIANKCTYGLLVHCGSIFALTDMISLLLEIESRGENIV